MIVIDHYLMDGSHFSDVIDVKVRKGANVEFDHFLVLVVRGGSFTSNWF